MKKRILITLLSVCLSGLLFITCNKETKEQSNGQIEFSFQPTNSLLKSGSTSEITENIHYAVVTIEDTKGNVVKSSEKIEIFNMNGSFISKPLSLVTGKYRLSSFILLDQYDKVIYATPVKASSKAYLISKPLPIEFDVKSNSVTKLCAEVISVINCKPEDFGYITFTFSIASTFDFLIGAFVYNEEIKNFELTTANIEIKNNNQLIYAGELQKVSSNVVNNGSSHDSIGITNKITLPEKYDTFTISIKKPGFKTFSQIYSKEELKLHNRSIDKGPLVIILENYDLLKDGLVAYYKFNGDVLDYSGNNNNGMQVGGSFTTGRKGDSNGALSLNGSSDYVLVKNSPSLNPTDQISICAWFYPVSFYGNGANAIVNKYNETGNTFSYQYHLGITGSEYKYEDFRKFNFYISTTQGHQQMNTYYNNQTESDKYKNYEWNFVVATYTGDSIKLYLNGNLTSKMPISGTIIPTNHDLYIGASYLFRSEYDYLKGSIDEIRIYNRALSKEEISFLYFQ